MVETETDIEWLGVVDESHPRMILLEPVPENDVVSNGSHTPSRWQPQSALPDVPEYTAV